MLQGLRWSLTVSKPSAPRHERGGGAERTLTFQASSPAQDPGPFCSADPCIYTDGGGRFVSSSLEVTFKQTRFTKKRGNAGPYPSLFYFHKKSGKLGRKGISGNIARLHPVDSPSYNSCRVGGEGWDGNCFTRQEPLELDLKHQQAFPR